MSDSSSTCEEEEEELPNVIELAADADLPGLFSIRPEFISLTVFRCGNETWGCDWGCEFEETEDGVVRISKVQETGLLAVPNIAACAAPEIPAMVLQEGDTLVSINDELVTKRDMLDPLRGILTLVFHTSSPSNMYQSLVLQPEGHGIQCKRNRRRRFLQISHLSDAWKHSVVKTGHLVLAIGLAPSLQLDPSDAEILLDSPRDVLCLTTAPDPSSFSWRKAVVGVGGGAMVGVGSVLMVTPLHPVGHGLALGGMGVLGTEFEAPRKLLNSATDRLRRRDSSKSTVETIATTEEEATSPEKESLEKASLDKKSVEEAAPEKTTVLKEATVT